MMDKTTIPFKLFPKQPQIQNIYFYMSTIGIRLFLLICLFMLFAGCESITNVASSNSSSSGPWPGSLAITFSSSISYEKALRMVADLGLQPAMDCVISSTMITPAPGKGIVPLRLWQPVGQKDTFIYKHQLLVDRTFPPTDWWDRLNATPGVTSAGFLNPKYGVCKAVTYETPSPSTAIPSPGDAAGIYAHIAFSPQEKYDQALYLINNEGLRLIDPCYEQATLQGQKPSWHPMGQEHTFSATHVFIVATSRGITSSLWLRDLKTLPGILSIEYPFTQKICTN